ncbi:hypothetical protein [Limisphaera sp. VF-2]|jgi:hypothetical protein|uniref:hypothetical protein n=1 Tax=Limisphaera sp. VF-2 TaxID=3400418 RepID=UPI001763E222
MAPPVCPCCGCRLSPEARVCPECGADEQTGWTQAWTGEAPGEEPFDYDEYVRREFGTQAPGWDRLRPAGVRWLWWFVGVGLLTLILLGWLLDFFGSLR